jgi:thiol-disulfide isomerase/thioredoxin
VQTFAACALAWPQAGSADGVPAPPAPALILFGAHWCAPCTAELHNLAPIMAALAALPAPPRLVLAWIDRPAPLALDHAAVVRPVPALAAAWAEPFYARAHGLPFAVLIDDRGKACAVHAGPLAPADVAALWAACHA